MESYGFDHAIDHRTLPKRTGEVGNYDWTLRKEELKKRLKAVAPNGIDMYYDNVGEAHFEAAFESLRGEGRIAGRAQRVSMRYRFHFYLAGCQLAVLTEAA